MRIQMEGEIETIPSENCFETVDFSNLKIERISDDFINFSGYMKILKSLGNQVYTLQISSESYDEKNNNWRIFPFQQFFPNMCDAFQLKESSVYSVSKLFTECPPVKGVSI